MNSSMGWCITWDAQHAQCRLHLDSLLPWIFQQEPEVFWSRSTSGVLYWSLAHLRTFLESITSMISVSQYTTASHVDTQGTMCQYVSQRIVCNPYSRNNLAMLMSETASKLCQWYITKATENFEKRYCSSCPRSWGSFPHWFFTRKCLTAWDSAQLESMTCLDLWTILVENFEKTFRQFASPWKSFWYTANWTLIWNITGLNTIECSTLIGNMPADSNH